MACALVMVCSLIAAAPQFEVASVKPNTSSVPMVGIFAAPGNPRFATTNASLRTLVTFAYNVKNFEISGGNGVIDAGRYDIEAKAAEPQPATEQIRLMAVKGGARLAKSKEGGCAAFDPASLPRPNPGQAPRMFCGLMIGPNTARGGEIAMKEFTDGLSNILGRAVIDKTGYTGTFDVALEFSQEGVDMAGMFGGAPFIVGKPPDDDSRPSIFTVLQDQMGLRLESQKGPAEILVIDHAEKASEN